MIQLCIVQNGTFEMTPEEGVTDNRPTCSLIQSQGFNILKKWNMLIDLDHPAKDSHDIVRALKRLRVTPEEIDVVLFTHLHPDHIGHKGLFPNALFMFHRDEKLAPYFKNDRTVLLEESALYELSDDGWPQYIDYTPDLTCLENTVYIRHCPGHTKGSLAVFISIGKRVYAIAGGIFLNQDYYENWQPPGCSWKTNRIYEHMDFIRENSDIIIPGHGLPFRTRQVAGRG